MADMGASGLWIQDTIYALQLPLSRRLARFSRNHFTRGVSDGEGYLLMEPEPTLSISRTEGALVVYIGRSRALTQLLDWHPDSLLLSIVNSTADGNSRTVRAQWFHPVYQQ
jgi:hypothetical protein